MNGCGGRGDGVLSIVRYFALQWNHDVCVRVNKKGPSKSPCKTIVSVFFEGVGGSGKVVVLVSLVTLPY